MWLLLLKKQPNKIFHSQLGKTAGGSYMGNVDINTQIANEVDGADEKVFFWQRKTLDD